MFTLKINTDRLKEKTDQLIRSAIPSAVMVATTRAALAKARGE